MYILNYDYIFIISVLNGANELVKCSTDESKAIKKEITLNN